MNKVGKTIVAGAVACLVGIQVQAANPAADDASDPAYSAGWANGSNGGYGFGAWALTPPLSGPNSGHFIGNSTSNADGLDNGNVNGAAADGDINTGAMMSAVAWGMYANNGNIARAIRPFTGGPLAAGEVFSVSFDNGYIESVGSIAVGLVDALNNPVLQVRFLGGSTTYQYIDNNGTFDTLLGYGDEGLRLSVTMTGATTYNAVLTRFDGVPVNWSGTMGAVPVAFSAVANNTAGPSGGSQFDLFINSMSIVPEPSTIALAVFGLGAVAVRCLRRRDN